MYNKQKQSAMYKITPPTKKVICPEGNITGSQKLFRTIFFSGNVKAKLYMGKNNFIFFLNVWMLINSTFFHRKESLFTYPNAVWIQPKVKWFNNDNHGNYLVE